MKPAKEICPTTTWGKVSEGALLIDVRPANEVAEIHMDVPKYLTIPLDDLEDRINEIPKDEVIVMISRDGEKSLRTTYFLMNAGYENVFNMSGGLLKWASKKFPTKGDVDKFLDESNYQPSSCC